MLLAVDELGVALLQDEEVGAVIIRGEDFALVADDERAAGGQLALEVEDVFRNVVVRTQGFHRLVAGAAVIPPEFERGQSVALGKFKADARGLGISVGKEFGGLLAFDDVGVTHLEGAKGHVHRVTGHVAEGTGAEVAHATPGEGVIRALLVGAHGRGSNP